jgi:lipopolysaccharide transport system ATP-binding protein
MASLIKFTNVSIDLPIYNATGRSLSSSLLKTATGGRLDSSPDGHVSVSALSKISFSLEAGDRVALVGHNGAGKTTLLRAMAKVYSPTQGKVEVLGKLGSLIDISLGINPEASGRENIFIRGQILGLTKSEIQKQYDAIVEFSELGDFIEMPVRTYSTGMHLRLAFSVSTIVQPQILLMDEWLSVGDEQFRTKAEKRMTDLVTSSEILVIATHTRELIEKVCNRVICLEHGQIVFDGPLETALPAYFH